MLLRQLEVRPIASAITLDLPAAFLYAGISVHTSHPDYQPELPGAKPGGRGLGAGSYDTSRLGERRRKVRGVFCRANAVDAAASRERREVWRRIFDTHGNAAVLHRSIALHGH